MRGKQWFGLIGVVFWNCTAGAWADHHHPRTEVTQILLSASVEKWHEVEFHRVWIDGELVGYRWVENRGDRDRRGPGAFRRTQHCFLFARRDDVQILREDAKGFEVLIRYGFEEENDQAPSEIRIRYAPELPQRIVVRGFGPLYDEFAAKIAELTPPKGPELEGILPWQYHPRPLERDL